MSHLTVKKTSPGKFRVFNKNSQKLEGTASTDKTALVEKTKTRDVEEDINKIGAMHSKFRK